MAWASALDRRSRGARYIPDAIAAGAAAIATDLVDPSLRGVTQLIADDLRAMEAALAAEFYGHPSRQLFTVGVTGTNGKTSTTYILKHLLDSLGHSCGLMGTIETLIGPHRHRTTLTTPDAPTLQKTLHEMVRSGCSAAVLEVSSHGLDQGRLSGVEFDLGIFTNLSQDHLDYHQTMEAYAAAKRELFGQVGTAILNRDDPYFETMRTACKSPPITYGLDDITDLQLSLSGTTFTLDGVKFQLPLIGRFNIYNTLAALAACRIRGLNLADLAQPLARTPQIRGRLERTGNAFVDYAHTPDALRQVLTTLNELKTGRLILVFGCGGDRDRDKRPKMGAVAEELADIAIVTSDNPRSEDPQAICQQVSTTLPAIVDRREAIAHALSLATPDDILLVAGKGHETQQIFAHSRLPFDDRATLEELCAT